MPAWLYSLGALNAAVSNYDGPIVGEEDADLRLHLALEAAQMGTWEWDPIAGQSTWDKVMFQLTGVSPGVNMEAVGHLFDIIHEEDRALFDHTISLTFTTGANVNQVFRITKPDNQEIRWLSTRGRLVRGPHNSVKVIGVCFDVTDLKEAQAALEQADRSKTEFLAMLSHELRSPLSPIATALEVLERSKDPQTLGACLAVMRRQTGQLRRLVDDLLDMTRASEGKVQLRIERVDIGRAVMAAIETVSSVVDHRRHQLEVKLPNEPIFIDGDFSRIVQIVTNLLHNAAKYTHEDGHIKIEVHVSPEWVYFTVEDDGPGIPEDVAPRLFDLFSQSDETRDRSDGGLGIGLALVKRMVDLHHGTVQFENLAPAGTRFLVCIPRKARQTDPELL